MIAAHTRLAYERLKGRAGVIIGAALGIAVG
jgi:hypothetical protein